MTKALLISSGNGPAECRQAVGHVLRVLSQEAEAQKVAFDVLERPAKHGPVSAVVTLSGARALELTNAWAGPILWRCASQLRPTHRRKNWFIEVFALPEHPGSIAIEPGEVTMTAIRAGGPGGQHQNKTSSAIRAVWQGYSVVVRDQRSQHQNRRLALERLQALAGADQAAQEMAQQSDIHRLHHQVQRGDPKRVFDGVRFKETRG